MPPLLSDEDKNFGRSLVLDFRKRLRHVKTIYCWYILDLETNPGSAVVDNIDSSKTICAPYSSSNILSSLGNRQFF